MVHAWATPGATGNRHFMSVDRTEQSVLDTNAIVSFTKDVLPSVELISFWPPEDGFVWSSGKWCELIFKFNLQTAPTDERGELVLDFDSYKSPPGLEGQNVFIYLNGLRIGARRLTKRVTAFIEFDPALLKATNVLTFDTPDAASPTQWGGTDERVLGIQLFTFQARYFAGPGG
jgi:hypothetical protein